MLPGEIPSYPMIQPHKPLSASCIFVVLAFSFPVRAYQASQSQSFSPAESTQVPSAALWRDRGNIASLDLIYGPGGKEHQPAGKFTFVKEDKQGTSPKFEIVDEQGVRWKAKLGDEAKSETAATRLVWAAGYFTDEDYYLPELRVEMMPKLERGREFVSADGVVRGVRLERSVKGQKKSGNWSWFKNPFVGTKELSGLKIMMALINNWDLKEVNNAIYGEKGEGSRYVVGDLGATFGETGNAIVRSKSNPGDYSDSKFIQKVTPEHVDFFLSSRPFVLSVFNVRYYATRTHMQDIVKDIPIADAKWLGKLLEPLSDEQIRDCFRAAGYSPEEVEGNAAMVKERIRDLNRL
ncbi:MAG: hypothetical protein JWO19_3992 [Bryobacterales bacterium]|nr:hypothetical protein [Bryobacterales bacterium]